MNILLYFKLLYTSITPLKLQFKKKNSIMVIMASVIAKNDQTLKYLSDGHVARGMGEEGGLGECMMNQCNAMENLISNFSFYFF